MENMDFVQGSERKRELINDFLSFSRVETRAEPFSDAILRRLSGYSGEFKRLYCFEHSKYLSG